MDYSKLPDLIAVGLLAWAFASVARHSHTPVSAHWLTAWLLIVFHFAAFMFAGLPGMWGQTGTMLGVLTLVWAGILFMRASVPYRSEMSSRAMLVVLISAYTLYVVTLIALGPHWLLNVAAAFMGLGPICVSLFSLNKFSHVLRWVTVLLHIGLGAALLWAQNRPNPGDAPLNLVLFTVYFSTSIHFWYMYRRRTAGAFITITGFFLWCSVFAVAPALLAFFPNWPVENEVWNLPKYVVAVGMILLLLEDQIAHNKHLALHDELTGLPNRRLFLDRLANALERARRNGSHAALLMLDLDHFKAVNDTLGHHAGDLLLQKVAQLFGGRVRRSDTVARTGGDEFAVVLESPIDLKEATKVGRSLLDMLTEPVALDNQMVKVGASLGVAIFPDDAEDLEALCIKADLRMYDEKRANEDKHSRDIHIQPPHQRREGVGSTR